MFFYLYKITNKVNGKIYVGVHKTQNLDDGYMGFGAIIQRAIKKHGLENFEKVILETFENQESMYAREKEVVTDEFLAREDVYNLRCGGFGGWDFINNDEEFRILKNQKAREQTNKVLYEKYGENWKSVISSLAGKNAHSEGSRTKRKNTRIARGVKSDASKMNTPEINEKRKVKYKETLHQQGEKNSQFGTCWIYHELIGNKKCKKDLLPLYLDQGWFKGRK